MSPGRWGSCPAWCRVQHRPGQDLAHGRTLALQRLGATGAEMLRVWLHSSTAYPAPTVSYRAAGADMPRALTLETLHQLHGSVPVAIAALEASLTAVCADCSHPYAPFGEGDEGTCLPCLRLRYRARAAASRARLQIVDPL